MNSRRLFSVSMVIAALLLSSCGNKGALVLPPKNASPDGVSSQVEETPKKAASGMQRQAPGVQEPRHNLELGEVPTRREGKGPSPFLAQRSDAAAQPFIQRFQKSS